jgi:N-acetylated-alpha-linked acidic dipeptidase
VKGLTSVADPHSGSAILIELAKAIGALSKTGWKPRRTIVLCSWDAEEYGLVGR